MSGLDKKNTRLAKSLSSVSRPSVRVQLKSKASVEHYTPETVLIIALGECDTASAESCSLLCCASTALV